MSDPQSTPTFSPRYPSPEPNTIRGLRFGLYLKLMLAYAVLMLAVYAFIPYFVVRAETSHLIEQIRSATPVKPADAVMQIADRSRLAVLVASLINAILMLFGVLLLRLAVRPVREVSDGLLLLARGEPVRRVAANTGDEIADLADSFNWLAVELDRYRKEFATREQELARRVDERTRELALQKQFVETVLETAEFGILTVDKELKITSWNSALQRLLGRVKSDTLGKNFSEVVPLLHRDVLGAELHATVTSGKSSMHREFESSLDPEEKGSGRWLCVDVASVALRDPAGEIIGALLTIYDVTERKELHMQLSQSTKLAAVGELAGGVAHEINNPLAIILGNSELLIDDLGDQNPLRKQAETIKRHALRCKDIVANLLKFAGRTSHGSGPVDLRRLLEETLALLRKQLELDNVRIEEKYDDVLGIVLGSSDELQQLFFSLISNARDAMPKGGVLTVEVLRDGTSVDIHVRDSGMGIPKDNLERVFSPFFTTKDPGKGTGLGLAIAHTIAQKHGGRITIASEVGKGTDVTVRLPVAEEAAPAAVRPGAPEAARTITVSKRQNMKILLVDDEIGIRMVCREALERMHHEVVECEDGLQALSKLGLGPYDLILMDLKMPNLDGAETLVRIRERDRITPVLIMTGLIDEEMLASVPPDSFAGIMKKPFQISELKAWIAKFSPPPAN